MVEFDAQLTFEGDNTILLQQVKICYSIFTGIFHKSATIEKTLNTLFCKCTNRLANRCCQSIHLS